MTFSLDDGEQKRARAFIFRHDRRHGRCQAAAGGRYTFRFTPTGLGDVTVIICGACRKRKDLTDYDAW